MSAVCSSLNSSAPAWATNTSPAKFHRIDLSIGDGGRALEDGFAFLGLQTKPLFRWARRTGAFSYLRSGHRIDLHKRPATERHSTSRDSPKNARLWPSLRRIGQSFARPHRWPSTACFQAQFDRIDRGIFGGAKQRYSAAGRGGGHEPPVSNAGGVPGAPAPTFLCRSLNRGRSGNRPPPR